MSANAPNEFRPSQRRLQRPPDFTGGRLGRFRQVWLRHGLPGALLGAVCLAVPEMRMILGTGLAGVMADPATYLSGIALIFGALVVYAWLLDRRLDAAAVGWILYLLAVSIWEEWAFRLAIPHFAQAQGFELRGIVVLSNLAFGLMHYFTLRWRWQWCFGAFLGGMALSRIMNEHFDLALPMAESMATSARSPTPRRATRRQPSASQTASA